MTERTRGTGGSTELLDHEHVAFVQRFRLSAVGGPASGATVTSSGDRVLVGSDSGATFVLDDRSVSHFHCEISISGGRARIRDLGSRNGTLVNGVSVLDAHLADGSVLTLGRSQVRFDLEDERVGIPLSPHERFGSLVGRSTTMRAVFAALERTSQVEATVLIQGETGTGKELAAESIHAQSARAEGPFIVVDCGSLPRTLVESELFGHEKGAFTGAIARRVGAFEAAHGGTVFLDEIGELPLELQPRLLRVLDRRQVRPLGANEYIPVDVRVIAATNRDLPGEVNARRFRADLYYRLALVQVHLPALRERLEDLPLLVESILASLELADRAEASVARTREFMDELTQHSWPGNVRELRNHVHRAVLLREPPESTTAVAETPLAVDASVPFKEARDRWLRSFERSYLEALLAREGGNIAAAARAAGIDRVQLYRLLWRNGLR